MDKNSEIKRVFTCLSPLLFPALGFIVGVILSLFLPGGGWWGLCSKLLMVCYALQGWAVGVCFIQQKRLFCGATQQISTEEWPSYARRYGFGVAFVSAGFILATIGLLGAGNPAGGSLFKPACGFTVYFFCLPITFAIIVGEIGWEDPLKFLKMFVTNKGGK